MEGKNKCECSHHHVIPLLVIIISIIFILGSQGALDKQSVDIMWPILLGIGGVVMIGDRKCNCC